MEEWRDIPGYEGKYQASSEGRIRSIDRICTSVHGRTKTKYQKVVKGRLKKLTLNRSIGYYVVNLGKNDVHYVHEIIAKAFCRGSGEEVRHLDGNSLNNKADNLLYGSHSENVRDKVRYGSRICKLTGEDVLAIRECIKSGASSKDIAKTYQITPVSVNNIKAGRTFSWLE